MVPWVFNSVLGLKVKHVRTNRSLMYNTQEVHFNIKFEAKCEEFCCLISKGGHRYFKALKLERFQPFFLAFSV
jgi:hypothetical protein